MRAPVLPRRMVWPRTPPTLSLEELRMREPAGATCTSYAPEKDPSATGPLDSAGRWVTWVGCAVCGKGRPTDVRRIPRRCPFCGIRGAPDAGWELDGDGVPRWAP